MNYKLMIRGMSCKECGKKIEKKLMSLDYITYARAYATKDYVVVDATKEVKKYKINRELQDLSYECHSIKTHQSGMMDTFSNVLLISIVVLLLVLGRQYVPTLNAAEGAYIGLSIVLVYGLLNSLHCMSMCGGLIVSRIMITKKGSATKEIFQYISGRLLSYTTIGAFLGALGSIFSINETFKGFVSLFAGIMMVLLALQLLGVIRLPQIIKSNSFKKTNSSFMLGIMNGFLPCGSLQVMQLYALSTGSLYYGALVMFVFAATTSLSLVTIASVTSKVRLNSKKIKILSVVIILFLGIQFSTQGISQISIATSNELALIDLGEEDEYQLVTVDVTGTYHFSTNEVKVGVPVKIEFGEINPDGCSNPFYIISPSGKQVKVDVLKDASPIIFTPEETGRLKIVCWMNMRSKSISVVQ